MLTSLIATCLEFYIVKNELETPAPIEI